MFSISPNPGVSFFRIGTAQTQKLTTNTIVLISVAFKYKLKEKCYNKNNLQKTTEVPTPLGG